MKTARHSLRKYTLVELLLVLGIFIIVTSISLPAFTRLIKGGGVSNGARTLCAKLNGARSYALAHRCYVALVFPMDATKDPNAPDFLRFGSFRPAIVYPTTSASSQCTFSKWVEGEAWERVPAGVFLGGPAYDSTMSTAYNGMVTFSVYCPVASCDFSDMVGSTSAGDIKICIVFKPDGSLVKGASSTILPFSIGVWEGGITTGSVPQPTNRSNKAVITVNQFTGKASASGR